jgi:hypothetical protein
LGIEDDGVYLTVMKTSLYDIALSSVLLRSNPPSIPYRLYCTADCGSLKKGEWVVVT